MFWGAKKSFKKYCSVGKQTVKNKFFFLKSIMIFKQELSPQNGRYKPLPLLCFNLVSYILLNNTISAIVSNHARIAIT